MPEPADASLPQIPVWTFDGKKPRLGSSFTWPIGVQRLSERFAHVPQYFQLQAWFDDKPMDHEHRMDQIARLELEYQLLTLWYSTRGDTKWYIMIYPIRRDLRAKGRDAIEKFAFPAADAWLCRTRTKTWLSESHHFRCKFNPKNHKITILED